MCYLKDLGGKIQVYLLFWHVIRFHNLTAIVRKYFTFLYAREKVNKIFTPAPFVSFPSGYSLRTHLVRAKVYQLIREKRYILLWKEQI